MYLVYYLNMGLVMAAIDLVHLGARKWIDRLAGEPVIWLAVLGYIFLWPLILSAQVHKFFKQINK